MPCQERAQHRSQHRKQTDSKKSHAFGRVVLSPSREFLTTQVLGGQRAGAYTSCSGLTNRGRDYVTLI